ncbi:MAG: hypothetical protein R3E79_57720 [Caldilineaceae bacterium]
MSYDFYASLHGKSKDDVNAVVAGQRGNTQITDIATRIQLLTGIAATGEKDYAISGDRHNGGGYKSLVHHEQPQKSIYAQKLIVAEQQRLNQLGLLKPAPSTMTMLPLGAIFLQFDFTLATPYLSKDDEPFYMTESVNPVRKDKVFKVPMIAASSWKGALRWATMQNHLVMNAQDLSIEEFAAKRFSLALLFGDEKGEEWDKPDDVAKFLNDLKPDAMPRYRQMVQKHFMVHEPKFMPYHRGRLFCYPTFFNLIDIEVINPHSRKTKAGTQPIYLESVPTGATGTFTLLYVPLDRIGQDEAETRAQVATDLTLVAEGVQTMFTLYGFGAKTSSGFGLAKEQLTGGTLLLNHPDSGGSQRPSRPVEPTPPPQPPELRTYLAEFPNEDFTLKPDEWRKRRSATNSQREAYKAARGARSDYLKALADHQQALARYQAEVAAWESVANTPQPPQMERTFTDFAQLVEQAQTVAKAVCQEQGGAA